MQFSLCVVSSALSLLGFAFSSVAILKPRSNPVEGYICDNVFITSKRVQSVVGRAKVASMATGMLPGVRNRLLSYYDGPPFMESYLLWPITPDSAFSDTDLNKPYRVVFDKNFRVVSVIMKLKEGVQECRPRQKLPQNHFGFDFMCNNDFFSYKKLVDVVNQACPRIGAIAKTKFPARYEGVYFNKGNTHRHIFTAMKGKNHVDGQGNIHRYIFPVMEGKNYVDGQDPGPNRVVMTSNCKLLGAIYSTKSGIYPCSSMGISLIERDEGKL